MYYINIEILDMGILIIADKKGTLFIHMNSGFIGIQIEDNREMVKRLSGYHGMKVIHNFMDE